MPRGPAGPGSSSLRSGRAAALVLAVTLGAGACSDPSFVPPDAPAALATTPPSPANDNQPRLTGTAASDLLILVYTDPFCAGPVVARGTGLQLQSPGIALDVADDTTTTFHVVGVRPDGFASPCSAGLTFVEDSTAPAPPTLTATDPASPGRALSVLVQGQAEAGTTVEIYTDSTCAGAVAATGTAADLATGLTVAVPPGATTTFAAVALDAAHNRSTCSKAALSYTQDGVAPDAPALDHTVPASPSNASTTPVVVGTAAPHAMIALYSTADCTGTALAENDADAAGDFALQVAVPANATTMLRATARDAAGNVSPCSPTALAYTHDDVAPATPVLGSTTPPSPTRASLTPTVHGTAEAGTQVGLYAEPGCAGPTLASVAAAADGAFAITVTVTGNTRTTFFAQARDAAGNLSDCTAAGLAYVHDSVAPVTPALTGTSPASPSPASTTPTVAGTAETGATVRVYAAADCTGAPLGEGAAADGTFAVAITVPANAATPLAVTATDAAGNVSACAGGLTYAHDSIAPAAPTVGGTAPASPTNVTRTPAVTGTAEAGATVTLYADGACGGAAAGTGAADTTGAFSVVLATPVATNVATQLSATATDTAGNVSPCATAIGYLFDDQAPAAPVLAAIAPASPAPEPRPTLSGSAEAGATVRVYATSTCGGTVYGTGVADGTGAFAITLTTAVPANQASTLRAAATDPAGNASPCSAGLAYAHDDIAPPAPSINSSTPPSPANTGSIVLHGTAQAGATVDIYVGAGCPGSRVATGTADGTGTFAITVSVANNAQTDFYARGVDAAGNVSTCSVAGFSFVEDSATPTVPAVTGTLPPSPSNDTNPTVIGTADPGVTVRLYADGACAGAVLGTGITNGSGGFSIAVVVPVDHTTTIYATATDVATNTSACGGGLGYTEDSTAPAPPSGITTTPAAATPSQNPRPTVAGAAEAGTTVRIYAGACTGTIYGTGIADGTGHFSIPLTVDLPEAADLIRATATDAATNVSLCATGPTYTFDQTRPAAPAITGTTPSTTAAGPANVATPTVTGTAEAGATVRIRTGSCTGAVVGAGPATGGNFSIVLTTALTAQGANTLYADATDAAGNTSATCATISYYFDSVLPAAPAITSTTPATTVTTPTNVTTPTVAGTAEADATVRLRTGSCTGAVVGAGPATGGNFSIVLTTALTAQGANVLYADAADVAGNTSATCATVSYYFDSAAPAAPTITSTTPATAVATPANLATPTVAGTAEADATVHLRTGSCTGAVVGSGPATGGNFSIVLTTALTAQGANVLYADATDVAGNTSATCATVTYYFDSAAPDAPTITGTTPDTTSVPSPNATPTVTGTVEAGATVRLHLGSCGGPVVGSSAAGTTGGGSFSIVLSTALTAQGANTLFADATDVAGNPSATCSTGFPYYLDTTAPTFAGLTGVTALPGGVTGRALRLDWSAATDATPPASMVYEICEVTTWGGCRTGFTATHTVTGATTYTVTALPDDARRFYVVRARDLAGNTDTNTVQLMGKTMGGSGEAAVVAGAAHTCVLDGAGTVQCTGANDLNQLGVTGVTERTTPAPVPGVAGARALAAGTNHTCAVLATGGVQCWGDNTGGQLGDPTGAAHPAPFTVPLGRAAVAVTAGAAHSCALLDDGTVACWGSDAREQLGNGAGGDAISGPVAVAGLTGAVAITAGDQHSCALLADGTAACWGDNSAGQLGDTTTTPRPAPVAVSGLVSVTALAAGGSHTCAVDAFGDAWCWGRNDHGQLGNGAALPGASLSSAAAVALPALDLAKGIAARAARTCAVLADDTLACWGDDASAPAAPAGFGAVAQPAVGAGYLCAVWPHGSAGCAGANDRGQLGIGSTSLAATPVAMQSLAVAAARGLASGASHTCALLADGGVRCFGDNSVGQLGDTTIAPRDLPVDAAVGGAVRVAAGGATTCAVLAGGTAKCWGAGADGQLGNGVTGFAATPVTVGGDVTPLAAIVDLATGPHTCAALADGAVWCWGRNTAGEIGDGTATNPHLALTAVGGLPARAVAVGVGTAHTCALLVTGKVACWGANASGQLGNAGAGGGSPGPVMVERSVGVELTGAVAIHAAGDTTCAVLADGTARCWGDGANGQLGDGSAGPAVTPVVVGGGTTPLHDVVAIATGARTCALRADGAIHCYGAAAPAVTGAVGVSVGAAHACVLLTGGTAACWGQNDVHQLGDATTTNRATLAAVESLP